MLGNSCWLQLLSNSKPSFQSRPSHPSKNNFFELAWKPNNWYGAPISYQTWTTTWGGKSQLPTDQLKNLEKINGILEVEDKVKKQSQLLLSLDNDLAQDKWLDQLPVYIVFVGRIVRFIGERHGLRTYDKVDPTVLVVTRDLPELDFRVVRDALYQLGLVGASKHALSAFCVHENLGFCIRGVCTETYRDVIGCVSDRRYCCRPC